MNEDTNQHHKVTLGHKGRFLFIQTHEVHSLDRNEQSAFDAFGLKEKQLVSLGATKSQRSMSSVGSPDGAQPPVTSSVSP